MAKELPALIPSTLLVIMAKLSSRVVATGIVAAMRMHADPWLVSIHVSRLHDWSPIAILYALSAPVLPFVLGSLLVPILGYAYLASRRAQQEMETSGQPEYWDARTCTFSHVRENGSLRP